MKFKKLLALTLVGAMTLSLAACGGSAEKGESKSEGKKEVKIEDVTLKVWGPEEEQELLKEMSKKFAEDNKDKVNLTVDVSVQNELDTNKAVLNDMEAAADVFTFANDQIGDFLKANALLEIPEKDFPDVKTRNNVASVETATSDGKLYAFPKTADNGFFLYYNKNLLSEEDVKSFEAMTAKAQKLGKKVGLEFKSGWYLFGFFHAAGLTTSVGEDNITKCDYNSTTNKYKGVDVLQSLINIAKHPGFVNANDAVIDTGLEDGSLIAVINGAWNSEKIKKAWGDGYAATKLPTFKVAGDDIQMYSATGTKLTGVNAKTKNKEWALKLADYLTSEEYQIKGYELRGSGPSNIKAAETDAVKQNVALSALLMQQQWAAVQECGPNFWSPTEELGKVIADGNKEGKDLQVLLDNVVKGVELPVQ